MPNEMVVERFPFMVRADATETDEWIWILSFASQNSNIYVGEKQLSATMVGGYMRRATHILSVEVFAQQQQSAKKF